MSIIKLSNKIFELGLTSKELSIYAYLCSLPNDYPMFSGTAIKVKQSTIAQKCGIKSVQTVAKVINSLAEEGLVIPLKRSVKDNGYKGTYLYHDDVLKLFCMLLDNAKFRHIFADKYPLILIDEYQDSYGYKNGPSAEDTP